MFDLPPSLMEPYAPRAGLWIAEWGAKSAALFAAASLAAAVLRRGSAASRHSLWTTAVVLSLVVPFASHWRPQWACWSLLPSTAELGPERRSDQAPTAPVSGVAAEPLAPNAIAGLPDMLQSIAVSQGLAPRGEVGFRPEHLAALWFVGAAAAALSVLRSRFALRRLARGTRPTLDTRLARLLWESRNRLGTRRGARLAVHEAHTVPLTFGIFRPVIVLPAVAVDWPDSKLQAVLLHELAHVARRDCLTQALARIACCVYWFNPLVWWGERSMRQDRERACDDLVLSAGMAPSAYAAHLLSVARELCLNVGAERSAAPMTRRSSLESRLRAVLDGRRNRSMATKRITLAISLAGVVVLSLLSGARLRASAVRSAEPTMAAQPDDGLAAALREAERLLEQGNALMGREVLRSYAPTQVPEQSRSALRVVLSRIAEETIFSSTVMAGDPLTGEHVVGEGETLTELARLYQVPPSILAEINGLAEPDALAVGKRLKIVRGPLELRVDAAQGCVDAYLQGVCVQTLRVGAELTRSRDREALVVDFLQRALTQNRVALSPAGQQDPAGAVLVEVVAAARARVQAALARRELAQAVVSRTEKRQGFDVTQDELLESRMSLAEANALLAEAERNLAAALGEDEAAAVQRADLARVEAAQARLDAARERMQRIQALVEQGLAPREELLSARVAVAESEAELAENEATRALWLRANGSPGR